jgi:hypothetical protein
MLDYRTDPAAAIPEADLLDQDTPIDPLDVDDVAAGLDLVTAVAMISEAFDVVLALPDGEED